VKGGIYLELLAEVDTICLDKTGTLTLGDPKVTDIIVYEDDYTQKELLEIAAIAEKTFRTSNWKSYLKRIQLQSISVP